MSRGDSPSVHPLSAFSSNPTSPLTRYTLGTILHENFHSLGKPTNRNQSGEAVSKIRIQEGALTGSRCGPEGEADEQLPEVVVLLGLHEGDGLRNVRQAFHYEMQRLSSVTHAAQNVDLCPSDRQNASDCGIGRVAEHG